MAECCCMSPCADCTPACAAPCQQCDQASGSCQPANEGGSCGSGQVCRSGQCISSLDGEP